MGYIEGNTQELNEDVKNYYKQLGVPQDATQDQIKKAYRDLAFKYHPDRNPGDSAAEERFKKITDAYSVLGDESKRSQYDLGGFRFDDSDRNSAGWQQGNGGFGQYTWNWTGPFASRPSGYKPEPMKRRDAYEMLFRSVLALVLGVLLFRFSLFFGIFGLIISVSAITRGLVNSVRAVRLLFSLKE